MNNPLTYPSSTVGSPGLTRYNLHTHTHQYRWQVNSAQHTKYSTIINFSLEKKKSKCFTINTCMYGIHTSILVASPPFTMGTVFPACILYGPIECPFRLRIGFTGIIGKSLFEDFRSTNRSLAFLTESKHWFKNDMALLNNFTLA